MSDLVKANSGVKFPTFDELVKDEKAAFENDQFNRLANMEPPAHWLKEHPHNKDAQGKPMLYLPIDKVEFLLVKMFGTYSVEVIETKQMFNAVAVTVRLHVVHPFTRVAMFFDGVGAVQLQVKKGGSPADLTQINYGAVQMALPAAKSYAIKDAADHIGKLFGKDLNRKDPISSSVFEKQAEKWNTTDEQRIIAKLKLCTTLEEVDTVAANNPDFDLEIFEQRREEIRHATEI